MIQAESHDYNSRSIGGYTDWPEVMREKAIERQAKYEYRICHKFPNKLIPEGEAVIMGTMSQTWMSAKVRYMKSSYCTDIGNGLQTFGEIARDYLVAKFNRATPDPKYKRADHDPFKAMPAFAKPGKYRDSVYVDVSGAYWSVLSIVGWSAAYIPGVMLGRGGSVSDFPLAETKLARNILVSASLPSKLYIQTSHGPTIKKAYNQLLNGHLWRLVSDYLHTIATFAHDECAASYFMTDGAIMPERYVSKYQEFCNSIGAILHYQSGVGTCHVKAVGCYKCPQHVTKNFARYDPRPRFALRAVDDKIVYWLRKWRTVARFPPMEERVK